MKNKAYVMMGYPGSGKSFICKKIFNETDLYLSSDELREELYGFRDQTHNKEVFEELYKRAISYADKGNVIIDSTALTRKDRARVINQLKKYYDMTLFCVIRPIQEVVQENENRKDSNEYIPEAIFKQILGRFQLPTYDEGWSEILFLYNAIDDSLSGSDFNLTKIEDIPHDNPHHSETIKAHIYYVHRKCLEDNEENSNIEVIARYHDYGKFFTIQYNEEKGYSQCIGHAAVSSYIYLTGLVYVNLYCGGYVPITTCGKDDYKFKYTDFDSIFTLDRIIRFYGIYYHDYSFSLAEKNDLIHSISKPSKPLFYLFSKVSNDPKFEIEEFVNILLRFNYYDRLREDEDE